ncbi:MAG TPA: thiosulfate oxidation carrier protein SoxY [Pseudomonadales bacterium]|nr:thiosulfate oxidation carrier protein SoxY [Pseudomonadales bacterium]
MSIDARRRRLLLGGTGLIVTAVLPLGVRAADVDALLAEHFGDRRPVEGGVDLQVSRVVENGNSVAVSIGVDGADAPSALHLLLPRNPEPWAFTWRLQAPARARVSTRLRLSGTQNVTAVAEWPDGTLRATAVSVLVTLGACLDDTMRDWVRP